MNVIVLGTSAISHTSAIPIIRGNMGADSIKLRIVINTETSFFFSRFWKDDRDIGNKNEQARKIVCRFNLVDLPKWA